MVRKPRRRSEDEPLGPGQLREPLHRLRSTDDQAARPQLAAPHGGGLSMEKAQPSALKVLNYGLATFLVALPAMVFIYRLAT